jgi:hypothetical protein
MARPAWARGKNFKLDDRNVKRILKMMDQMPQALRDVAYKKALSAPAKIAARKVRELTPIDTNDGRSKGGTGRWSKLIREGGVSQNDPNKVWSPWATMQKLHKAVRIKLISNKRSKRNPVALVGYDYLDFGQTIYFNHPWDGTSRQHHLWSTPNNYGPHRTKSKSYNWVNRAGQETKAAQLSAFRKAFMKNYRSEMKKIIPKT